MAKEIRPGERDFDQIANLSDLSVEAANSRICLGSFVMVHSDNGLLLIVGWS